MKIGMVGLGRMGFHMSERLLTNNIPVVAYNRSPEKVKEIIKKGAQGAFSLKEFVKMLGPDKKIVWLMLPAGKPTEQMIKKLLKLLNSQDIIINGANAFYQEARLQSQRCQKKGVHLFDVGVSGGIHGFKNGYTLMVGGSKAQFKYIELFCQVLAPPGGYGYFGEVGAGHFVKSVHNIVEYVYLEGLAEGVELLANFDKDIDVVKATQVWHPASVIRSWLLDLTSQALSRKDFASIKPDIASVTIKELVNTKKSVKGFAPAFDVAVKIRKDKSGKFMLGKRVIAAVRREFGGHDVQK